MRTVTSRSRRLALVTALAGALLLSSCGSDGPSDSDATTIRFGLPTNMGANNSPMAVAENLGYFEEEGLDVEIVVTGDSTSIVQGIDSGSLEIGSTPPEPVFQAMTKGSDLELVYNYIRKQTGSIAVLADSGIESLEDFRGQVIGQASLGTSNLLLSNGILASAGLEEDVDFTNLAVGTGAAALQALENGQVAGLSLWDTEYAAFEASGVALRYFTIPEVESLFSTTYFTSADFAAQSPDAVAGFGRAMAKATLFTAENPEAALRIMYEDYPDTLLAGVSEDEQLETDLVALTRRIELLVAEDPQANGTWGAYTEESVRAWTDFAFEAGIIDTALDPAGIAPNAFVEQYNDFDGAEVLETAQTWGEQ